MAKRFVSGHSTSYRVRNCCHSYQHKEEPNTYRSTPFDRSRVELFKYEKIDIITVNVLHSNMLHWCRMGVFTRTRTPNELTNIPLDIIEFYLMNIIFQFYT